MIELDGHKLAYHGDRVKAWQDGERIAPISLQIALTRRCNYNCVYCYSKKFQENEPTEITRDVAFRFLDDASEIGVKSIAFISDGESTLSPFLTSAIWYGWRNGLDIALGTNGYKLNLTSLPYLTYLRFNISGVDRYKEIHGVDGLEEVKTKIRQAVSFKKHNNLKVTIGLQMVLLNEYTDQIEPLAQLGGELGVDYLVIKHCSDDETRGLGIDYSAPPVRELIKAETYSTPDYLVKPKWSKIVDGPARKYTKCFGCQFMTEISGSGLVASCGLKFNSKYAKNFHIGNICDTSYKKIWESDRYWQVQRYLASNEFDVKECGALCLQHKINEYLWDLREKPEHINFI